MGSVDLTWLAKLLVSGLGGAALVIWGPPDAHAYGLTLLGAAAGMIATSGSTATK